MLCPNHMNVLKEDKLKPTWCKSIRVFCFILIKYFFLKKLYDIIFLWYFSPTVQLLIILIISGMILIFLRALQICIVSWNENRKMAPECKNMQTHWTWLVYLIENMRFRGKIADIGCIQHFTSKVYIFLSLNLSTVE